MGQRHELVWFAGALALLVAGCGGGGGDADGGADDGGRDAAVDAGGDGGGDDAGTMDAGGSDAGGDDAGSSDGGGSDGGGSDGGTEDAATGDGGVCTACLESALDWGRVGGFVAWQARSEVAPCNDYGYERTMSGSGSTETCGNRVPCSSADQVDMGDLLDALAHEDVVAAFEAAPVLYGRDTRPIDGQVFEISQDGKTIQVGTECSGSSECMEIPPGVAALRDLLDALEDERLDEEDCASTFPGG